MAGTKNKNAVIDLIRYRIRAIESGYWLEALILAHLFVETQLRLILSGILTSSGKCIPKNTIDGQKYVMQLANLAKDNGIIDEDTWALVRKFNTVRNQAVHDLSSGDISYEDLRVPAMSADDVISRLQSYYVIVSIGPEMKASD
jgi:uncharacterized protein YutE (UPF0331/DUF86 family)